MASHDNHKSNDNNESRHDKIKRLLSTSQYSEFFAYQRDVKMETSTNIFPEALQIATKLQNYAEILPRLCVRFDSRAWEYSVAHLPLQFFKLLPFTESNGANFYTANMLSELALTQKQYDNFVCLVEQWPSLLGDAVIRMPDSEYYRIVPLLTMFKQRTVEVPNIIRLIRPNQLCLLLNHGIEHDIVSKNKEYSKTMNEHLKRQKIILQICPLSIDIIVNILFSLLNIECTEYIENIINNLEY